MDTETRLELQAMTAAFYETHAESFSDSRQSEWDSWDLVLSKVGNFERVLDVGCGNGRFLRFLRNHDVTVSNYLGIDTSASLLAEARNAFPDDDFIEQDIDKTLGVRDAFDLVVAFGLFHHLPGAKYRLWCMSDLAGLVNGGGHLVISFWQPKLLSNFENKLAPNEHPGLEENDYLLGWNGDFSKVRYCHHFSDDEIDQLIEASGLTVVDRFQGNGNDKSNHYVVLNNSKPSRPAKP